MIYKTIKDLLLYLVPLFLISPIIDHLFGELNKSYSDIRILLEIIFHLTILIIFSVFIQKFIEKKFKTDKNIPDFIIPIVLIGLQKNLQDKLNYITYKHPIRLVKLL
tara:strand:+ start:218 stop:538 length:321 start_codon:yes stop_codon:yes gene_type:complete